MLKVIAFDLGQTLIRYNSPLNWSSLYIQALGKVMSACSIPSTEKKMTSGISILTQYNTRTNPRAMEVTSDQIFIELLKAWQCPLQFIETAKHAFYSFFQASSAPFDEVLDTLTALREKRYAIAVLTDVAYGMDNDYSLKDLEPIKHLIDVSITSLDVGYRKPHPAGFQRLLDAFDIQPSQMIYVGDEEKDIIGANKMGIPSALINRSSECLQYGQVYTLRSLHNLLDLLKQL